MDRSQQGVAPRTCLSKQPLKPRQGPPPGARAGPPRSGPGLMGPPPRPIPGAKIRQGSSSSQGSAASQSRRPSMAPSKQSSPTLAEQAQSRQRSIQTTTTTCSLARRYSQSQCVDGYRIECRQVDSSLWCDHSPRCAC
jgi:hypothetical protein